MGSSPLASGSTRNINQPPGCCTLAASARKLYGNAGRTERLPQSLSFQLAGYVDQHTVFQCQGCDNPSDYLEVLKTTNDTQDTMECFLGANLESTESSRTYHLVADGSDAVSIDVAPEASQALIEITANPANVHIWPFDGFTVTDKGSYQEYYDASRQLTVHVYDQAVFGDKPLDLNNHLGPVAD